MSRNSMLFVAMLAAIIVGLLVSYFPPAQNAVSIWSLVSMAAGYGIRDLFVGDAVAAPGPAPDPTPAPAAPVPPVPASPVV